jgi:surfeit locus 1 family protein
VPELVPPPSPQPHGIAWRNAAYAVQWWVFAGFALVMWWKMVQQAARDEAAQTEETQREHTRT